MTLSFITTIIRHAEIDNELFLLMKDERCREELRKNLRNYLAKDELKV